MCDAIATLYGSESWILSEATIKRLEAFQSELRKGVLKWPRHHSNTVALATLDAPTMKRRVLVRKLEFLKRVIDKDTDSLRGCVVMALCCEVESICLIRECKELENFDFTESISSKNLCSLREMEMKKTYIMEVDRRCREMQRENSINS